MNPLVLGFRDIDKTKFDLAGGKGANLGELSGMEGIYVPDGFCVSTDAYKRIIAETHSIDKLLDRLSQLNEADRPRISEISSDIRRVIETITIPDDLREAISRHLITLGENDAFAVRSSATAEDLPTASFAGQQDTYLNIIGNKAVLTHIARCWASLFTERAVTYRMLNGFDHRKVQMAVIVQKMVFPQASGILFTADPLTSNRKILSIDAGFGLGEALVAGLVTADNYKVRNGQIIDKNIAIKKLAIYALNGGGTRQQEIAPEQQGRQVLTDKQMLQLDRIGRTIEKHFGYPQDIEWCLANDTFFIVQSRPITTLFPIPGKADRENRVYVSVGHQQMMTDAMKPLGISMWQLTTARPMVTAGGRLFVDITENLTSPTGRSVLIDVLGKSDPLIKDALMTITARENFLPFPDDEQQQSATPLPDFQTLKDYGPTVVSDLISRNQTSIGQLKRDIQTTSGTDLFDFILDDIRQLKKLLFDPQSFGVIMTAMNASAWINEKMQEWLGEKNTADTLSRSAPNNVTSEMGLELLNVADVIRPYPEVVHYLEQADDLGDRLIKLNGGKPSRDAIYAYLEKYGMRCVGEIDITRTRWSERPITLVPLILNYIRSFEPDAGRRKFEQGHREASQKEEELLHRLAQLPDGEPKVEQTKKMIRLIRNLVGYREYPKYAMICRYGIYKEALKKEAERLAQANVIREKEDVFYLSFEEFHEVVRTHQPDHSIIAKRKAEFKAFEKLSPPRIITSEGEILTGVYKREDLPDGALPGLPVSSGVAEGRARVILNLQDAVLEKGDILVTTFTDPSWTPVFVSIIALVTEVGGLMTHGAVIAREYGLPAVVGVENATQRIKDGQRIRVHGSEGYVEITASHMQ